jgi:Right handed beta helix region
MRSILRWCALCASIALASLMALPAGAVYANENGGRTFVVRPGDSIQKAIDKAPPGSTIVVKGGTYTENLTIAKDHITLRSEQGLGSVVLKPPATPTPSICLLDPSMVSGICAAGESTIDPTTGQLVLGTPVTGTRIDGFVVQNFTNFGVFLFNANDTAVTNSVARNNKSYGISGFIMSGIRFLNNVAHDNGEPGFYIGDSPNADALVVGNRSFHNGVGGPEGLGFLFRDSSHGVVRDNSASDNCAGFVFLDSSAPGPATDWRVVENSARHNNGACVGEGGGPPTSGTGFLLFGTDHVTLQENTARGNSASPSVGAGAIPSGGIVVISADVPGVGGPAPTNNLIAENKAFSNSPVDILWDKSGSGNRFEGNRCRTSLPPALCQSGRDD